jgi:hypothetical protein
MKESNAGLKSNLQKVDSHEISQVEYDEIPELPDAFFAEGKLYKNGRPVKRNLNLDLSREEIVRFVREGRNRE